MNPGFSVDNSPHSLSANSIFAADCCQTYGISRHTSDDRNVIFSESRIAIFATWIRRRFSQSGSVGMKTVPGGGRPFKVLKGIVLPITVLVVHMVESLRLGNERKSNQAVYPAEGNLTLLAQNDLVVTIPWNELADTILHNAFSLVYPLDAAKRRYCIGVFISWYWAPFFAHKFLRLIVKPTGLYSRSDNWRSEL